jgi:hypothetical protein
MGRLNAAVLTCFSISYDGIQRAYEVGKDLVNLVQSCQHSNDIRTRVGVFLWQHDREECRQGLAERELGILLLNCL